MHVISVALPEASFIAIEQLDARDPLRGSRHFAANAKLPTVEQNLGRAARVEYRPLQRARLPGRHAVRAARIRADDDVGRQSVGRPHLLLLRLGLIHPEHSATYPVVICTSSLPTAPTRANDSTSIGHTVTQMPQPIQELLAFVIGSCLSA